MATKATAASQQTLAKDIATYLAIPSAQRSAKQSAALATDEATYAKQQNVLNSGAGAATSSPVQLTNPFGGVGASSGTGPVGSGAGAASSGSAGTASSASGSDSSWLLLLGGGALLLLLLLKK